MGVLTVFLVEYLFELGSHTWLYSLFELQLVRLVLFFRECLFDKTHLFVRNHQPEQQYQ